MNPISSCLWFDNQAEEAVDFYTSVFKNSKSNQSSHYGEEGYDIHGKPAGSVLSVDFQLANHRFLALNGGPNFHFNPAISFYVTCKTDKEIIQLWSKLADSGSPMMALDAYPFSEKYGWIEDKFGVSWQLILPFKNQNSSHKEHKIAPCLMFASSQQGNAEAAMNFYMSVFKKSEKIMNEHYTKEEAGPNGMVKHAEFLLNGQNFVAMDSGIDLPHKFNEAISFVVNCHTQNEVDYFWEKLSNGGDPNAQQCGWLKDKYGVSWQIIPDILGKLLNGSDYQKSENVMNALLKMKKLDINELQNSYDQ